MQSGLIYIYELYTKIIERFAMIEGHPISYQVNRLTSTKKNKN